MIITGIGDRRIVRTAIKEQPLDELVGTFLTDFAYANRSSHTLHVYVTVLINGGVRLPTIRKRLGHKNLQTTLR